MNPDGGPTIRVGTAPDSWGVWFPEHPRQTPWSRFLDEVQQAGYQWIELGPYGYLPTDPHRLEDELAARDLRLSGGTVVTGLHRGLAERARATERVDAVAALVAALGGTNIVVIPEMWRSELTGEQDAPRTLTPEQWAAMGEGHNWLGRHLAETWGMTQQFHSHVDTHVASEADVQRLLEVTEPDLLSLCLDTGHYAFTGADTVSLIERFPERIGYLHLKQVDPHRSTRARDADTPFAVCASEVMVEPPSGVPEFAPIIDAVLAHHSDLFAIVEQDMPGVDPNEPLAIATRTRRYLQSLNPAIRMR